MATETPTPPSTTQSTTTTETPMEVIPQISSSVAPPAPTTTPPPPPSMTGEKVLVSPDLEERAEMCDLLTKQGATIVSDPSTATCAVLSISPMGPQMLPSPESNKLSHALLKQGIRVYGSKCVKESVEMRKPLPQGVEHAVISRAFENVVMACDTELLNEMGTALREVVELMNGRFVGDQLPSETTILCGKTSLSQAFLVASQRNIPVVRTTWVSSCFKAQALLTLSRDFVLPPMSGCVVCVTGLSLPTRQYVQQMVVSLGGAFSAEFSKRCTHLVAISPTGPKFKASQLWRIPAVSLDWLLDCVNLRACQPTAPYAVSEATTAPQQPTHDITLPLQLNPAIPSLASTANTNSASSSAPAALSAASSTTAALLASATSLPFPFVQKSSTSSSASNRHRRRVSDGSALRTQPYIIVTKPRSSLGTADPTRTAVGSIITPQQQQAHFLHRMQEQQQQQQHHHQKQQQQFSRVLVNLQTQQQQGATLVRPQPQPIIATPAKNDGPSLVTCFRTPQPVKESRTPGMEAAGQALTPPGSPRRMLPSSAVAGSKSATASATLEEATSKLQSALSQLLDACDSAITSLSTPATVGSSSSSSSSSSGNSAGPTSQTTNQKSSTNTDPTLFSP